MDILKRGFNSIFLPNNCAGCGKSLLQKERLICLPCIGRLPLTNSHNEQENLIERIFWGRIRVEKACSYLYYKQGGMVQKIMHQFKYKNKPEIGNLLGSLFAKELSHSQFIQNIELIIPVPIHPKKHEIRGYNQSEYIAIGLSQTLNIPWNGSCIQKVLDTESQTKKKRYERWKNVENVFEIKNMNPLRNKHILLIDDVLTTGSTLEACSTALLEVEGTTISIATIAVGL